MSVKLKKVKASDSSKRGITDAVVVGTGSVMFGVEKTINITRSRSRGAVEGEVFMVFLCVRIVLKKRG